MCIGTNAIGEALRMIRHGYADAMIAGCAEIPSMKLQQPALQYARFVCSG
ncbi:MAG: hypothetical protein ACLR13_09775 [Acutalibacteraceae bacterium]